VEAIEIKIESRQVSGSNANKKFRLTGKIPGVIYSQGQRGVNVAVDAIHLYNTLRGVPLTHLFKMVSDDKVINGKMVLVKDLQIDPVKQQILHFDLYEIHKGHKVTVVVPIVLTGEPVAVKQKEGTLAQSLFEVEVECQPTAIPDEIALDVSELQLGHSLFIKDLKVADGVRIKEADDLNVVTLAAVEEEKTVSVAPATETVPAAQATDKAKK
jgi:large subunit ribosomal protein L25